MEKREEKYKKQPPAEGGVVEHEVWSFCS